MVLGVCTRYDLNMYNVSTDMHFKGSQDRYVKKLSQRH